MFRKKGLRKALILVFWIMVWYLLTLLVNNSILLVTPWRVLQHLGKLLLQGEFWQTIVISLLRIGGGFLFGLLVALLLAGMSLRYSLVEEMLHPLMSLMKTVPVASFVVLFLIWWGSSALAVAISFLVVVPNVYINTLEGLKAVDVRLLEMAKVFRLNVGNRFFFIYRPALKPFLISGMRLALGMCWKSGVAAEVIGTPVHSIGGELYLSKIYLDTAGVLAWTVVIVLLSLCFERLVLGLTDSFFSWMPEMPGGMEQRNRRRKRRSERMTERSDDDKEGIRLSINRVSKTFGAQRVLSEVSAVYEAGKTYYLTSPSGSGKTTLLRLLCGLEKADAGNIEGTTTCSMVFQEDRLCEEYSAIQNVMMVTGDERRAEEALSKLLEKDALYKPCSQLSGGMKRRVTLVRAMEAESEVVLLDEPFTGMDAETKQEAEMYIRERQAGRVLVIATHMK